MRFRLRRKEKFIENVGNVFMIQSKDQIFEHLNDEINDNKEKILAFEPKKYYLERSRITDGAK